MREVPKEGRKRREQNALRARERRIRQRGYRKKGDTKKGNREKKITITRFSKKTQYVIKNIKKIKKLKKAKKYLYIRVKSGKIIGKRRLHSKKWSRIRRVKIK